MFGCVDSWEDWLSHISARMADILRTGKVLGRDQKNKDILKIKLFQGTV